MISSRLLIYAIMCSAWMSTSCQHVQRRVVIARVGDAELTLDDARASVDTLRSGVDAQIAQYATAWVNEELLYQEAKRSGLESSPSFVAILDRAKRQLAGQEYLQQQLHDDTSAVGEQVLMDYYRSHSSEFVVRSEMMRLNIITFLNRDPATAFDANIARGATWDQAVKAAQNDSSGGTASVLLTPPQYYSQRTIYPVELWKVPNALNVNEVSFPIKTSNGYTIVQLLARIKEGTTGPFDMVRDEVRQRVTIMNERLKYNEILGTLRKRFTVELHVGSPPPVDTSQFRLHE